MKYMIAKNTRMGKHQIQQEMIHDGLGIETAHELAYTYTMQNTSRKIDYQVLPEPDVTNFILKIKNPIDYINESYR
ncbi:hypothetical protein QGM71_01210 [Virgibacillus sp. C22-A2]|uniref:Uncharacterized protein n=1 Tax=Virgibacillus tibetensis TaxID=3042313 RepID=A0ABU6KAF8_9BACI|nr:hypothetical protein [Virgibacillus sp. C22-A2]